MKTIAITGASGYVGSIITNTLSKEGYEIVTLGRRPVPGFAHIHWSLQKHKHLSQTLRSHQVTTLIHCAYDFSMQGAAAFSANVSGSEQLLRDFLGSGGTSAIHISTMSAFSGCRSQYGNIKLEVEAIFTAAGQRSLRLGLVYGSGSGGMVGSLKRSIIAVRGVMPSIGNGKFQLYMLHERDLSSAMKNILRSDKGTPGPTLPLSVLTIADPKGLPFNDILRNLAAEDGLRLTLIPVPWQLLWAALKTIESVGLVGRLRADGLIGLVFSDQKPQFSKEALSLIGR